MSESTLDRLTRLLDEATPGPWIALGNRFDDERIVSDDGWPGECIVAEMGQCKPDADLIIEMYAALPALLRIARAVEEHCVVQEQFRDAGQGYCGFTDELRAALAALGETPE